MATRSREDLLRQAISPTPPSGMTRTNRFREKTQYSMTGSYYVDASYVPRALADPHIRNLHKLITDFGDWSWAPDNASLALYGSEGVDCTLWFKDTLPNKPAKVFLAVEIGARYLNARLLRIRCQLRSLAKLASNRGLVADFGQHIRPSTIVHATLKIDDKRSWSTGRMIDVKTRLPADFTGLLVVTVPNDGSQRIDLPRVFQQRTRVISSVVLPPERPKVRMHDRRARLIRSPLISPPEPAPEMISHTLFVGKGYDESTPWKGTAIKVEGRSAHAVFLTI